MRPLAIDDRSLSKKGHNPPCLMPSFCITIPSIFNSAESSFWLAKNQSAVNFQQNWKECFFSDITHQGAENGHAPEAPNHLVTQSQPVSRIENLNWGKFLHIEISFRFLDFCKILGIFGNPQIPTKYQGTLSILSWEV